MPHYWVAIYRPDDYDPAAEDEAMGREISALNADMIAAGVRRWACGLGGKATSLRAGPGGDVRATAGRIVQAGEHVGGFWILETADLDAALAWGRRAAVACRAAVEVRAILQKPTATG